MSLRLTEQQRRITDVALSSDRLHLILMATEQCNFRCVYCYEDFAIGRMRPWVVEGVKKLVASRIADISELFISWFGGEPLLASELVTDVSRYCSSLAMQNGVGFDGNVTTNAWFLSTEVVKELCSYGIRGFQVSLDGVGAVHDRTRRRRDGTGSFDTIWKNLIALKATDIPFSIYLRIHFTPDNLTSIYELIELAAHELLSGDERFSMGFHAVGKWGGMNDETMHVFDSRRAQQLKGELIDRLQAVIAAGGGQACSSPALTGSAPDMPAMCYAGCANSFLIRADGRVGKCTVALADERNTVGRLTSNGRLELDSAKVLPWLRGLESFDLDVLRCPLMTLPGAVA